MSGGTNGPLIYDGIAYTFTVKTLLQLRQSLMIRLGFSAQLASPPPGITELLNDFLVDAQEQMYERYSPLRNQRWWPIQIEQGERHYDIPSISTGEITADFLDNDPLVDTITRLDVGGDYIADGFAPGMVISNSGGTNDQRTFVLAAVTASVLTTSTAGNLSTEAGVTVTINTISHTALNMRKIQEQWVQDGSTWNLMIDGIPTGRFNETGQAYPQNYEWRNHLEIWPEPDKAYVIWVKGHFGLLPFTADTDVTTIEHNLVFLHALANSKAHYGQADARIYFRQLEVFLRRLNAGEFGNKRFIPDPDRPLNALAKPEATWR